MPQRTNDFQRLVALIHHVLAGRKARVTESAMVQQVGSSEVREVDVLIENETATYTCKIAVEAKDHRRKLDVHQIEAFIGKYSGAGAVDVDKVIVVSASGFTKPAIRKAKANRIVCMTVREAKAHDWTNEFLYSHPQEIHLDARPWASLIHTEPLISQLSREADIKRARVFCRCHESDHGSVQEVCNKRINELLQNDVHFARQVRCKIASRGVFRGQVIVPMDKHYLVSDGQRYEVQNLLVSCYAINAKVPLKFEALELVDSEGVVRKTHRGIAEVDGIKFEFGLVDEAAPETVIVRPSGFERIECRAKFEPT